MISVSLQDSQQTLSVTGFSTAVVLSSSRQVKHASVPLSRYSCLSVEGLYLKSQMYLGLEEEGAVLQLSSCKADALLVAVLEYCFPL